MIEVSLSKCTGCGACVQVCPAKAVRIADGHAVIDEARCRGCEVCVDACPEGALRSVTTSLAPVAAPLPQPRPEAVIDLTPVRAATPTSRGILPALGSAVAFVGREILPPVLEFLASRGENSPAGRSEASRVGEAKQARPTQAGNGGHRHRQRRRGS